MSYTALEFKAPVLKAVETSKIVQFVEEKRKYLQEVADYNLLLSKDAQHTPKQLKQMIDYPVLLSLCVWNKLGENVTVETVTNDQIQLWINGKVKDNADDFDIIEQKLKKMKQKVKLNQKIEDIEDRVEDLLLQMADYQFNNNLLSLNTKYPDQICQFLLASVKPSSIAEAKIQKAIRQDREEGQQRILQNPQKMKSVLIEALKREQQHHDDAAELSELLRTKSIGQFKKERNYPKHTTTTSDSNSTKTDLIQNKKTADCSETKPKPDCLICHQPGHWYWQCRKASNEEKDKVRLSLSKNYNDTKVSSEDKKSVPSGVFTNTRSHAKAASEKQQEQAKLVQQISQTKNEVAMEYMIVLEDKIVETAILDSGASISVLPKSTLNRLQDENIWPKTNLTKQTSEIQLAIDGPTVPILQQIRLDIAISSPQGIVQLQDVDFIIIDANMNQVLLGYPLLKKLQIDPDSSFNSILASNNTSTTKLSDSYLNYNNIINEQGYTSKRIVQDHQAQIIDDPHDLDIISVGDSTPTDEVNEAINAMFAEATSNGLSTSALESLKQFLFPVQQSLFRLELGADPPAQVLPYRATLKPHSAPIIAALRRYPSHYRQFIKEDVQRMIKLGLYYPNPLSRFALAILVVPKPHSNKLRLAVDARPINMITQPIAGVMTDPETVFREMKNWHSGFKLDLTNGY